MGVLEITSLVFTASISFLALIRILNETRKNICSIIINILLGGIVFIIFNIIGFKITLNFITGGIIALLGLPGTILIVFLKLIFKIF